MIPPEIPQRRSGISCWTVGLLSCLGAVAILIVVIALITVWAVRQPEFKQVVSSGMEIGVCQQNLTQVHAAIERYRQKQNGQYPRELKELTPRYLPEAQTLKCPADRTSEPISYRYFRPMKDTEETAPLLRCENHRMFNETTPLVVLKNGQVRTLTPTRRPAPQQQEKP